MSGTSASGVNLKFERARQHLVELDRMGRAYLDTQPFEALLEAESETSGPASYRVRVREQPPEILGLVLGDALHNARSALDHVACQLVERAGSPVKRQTMFPTGETRTKFMDAVKRGLDGASESTKTTVRDLKVYPGGDDLLWRLHTLDIDDKHKILIPLGMTYRSVNIHTSYKGVESPPIGLRPEDPLYPVEDGTELLVVQEEARFADTGPIAQRFSFNFDLALAPAPAERPRPVVETVTELIDHAESIATALLQ